ncbi:MAG: LPS export ABC transporter periplasmic protein LptC [Thermodesulfovibrionales bacterium]
MKRIAFLLSLLFLIVTVFYMRLEYNRDYIPRIQYGDNSYMEDVVIEQKRSGNVKWTLFAKRANYIGSEDISLEDITVTLHDKGYTLKTANAFYNMTNKNFTIPGEVIAVSKDVNIEGSNLFWDASSSSLKAHGDIRLEGKGFKIEGDELTATSDKAILNKNVRAIFDGK